MARGGAGVRPNTVIHSISRFVAGEYFMESDVERRTYLYLLEHAIAQTDWRVLAYALMSTHIHLALLAGQQRLKRWLAPMHTDFAHWLNRSPRLRPPKAQRRIGAVFVKGPNVFEFPLSGVGPLINYIHCNPVRAGVVAHPSDSDWTSHRAYLGLVKPPACLDVERGLSLAGFASGADLDDWMTTVRVEKAALDELRVVQPRRPGRPRGIIRELGQGRAASRIAVERDERYDVSDSGLIIGGPALRQLV